MLIAVATAAAQNARGQQTLAGVWVLNEGYGDALSGAVFEPVEVGRFDPVSEAYEVVATVEGSAFASDLIVTESGVYVVAQGQIQRYDRDSGALLASTSFDGGRSALLHGDRLYVSRGDFDQLTWEPVAFDSYLVWFDAITLEWEGQLGTEEGPAYASEGMVAIGEHVFIAINNGFAWGEEVGIVGRYAPSTGEYVEFDLGENGKNPVHLLERDGILFTVNNNDWSTTSLSRIEAATDDVMSVPVAAAAAGCNAAALVGEQLAFQVQGEFEVRAVELDALVGQSPLFSTAYGFYAMAQDPISGRIYASETDWFSYGQIHVYEPNGSEAFAFDCGVSPGVIAMDVREANGIASPDALNPSVVRRFDLTGREVPTGQVHQGILIEQLQDGSVRKRFESTVQR